MIDTTDRFWSKVDASGDCWLWTSAKRGGYGTFTANGKTYPAHRFAYELLVGPVPGDLHMDHLCRNKPCVNPDHLEPVTNRVNVLRGVSVAAARARQTHCQRGHPFDEANTIPRKGAGRRCRECIRMQVERNRLARVAKRSAAACGWPLGDRLCSRSAIVLGPDNVPRCVQHDRISRGLSGRFYRAEGSSKPPEPRP